MNIIKKRFALHIRKGCLPYAYVYKKALYLLISLGAIAVSCYDLAQREASLNQAVLYITAAVSCILLTTKILSEYAEMKHRFFKHGVIRRSRIW